MVDWFSKGFTKRRARCVATGKQAEPYPVVVGLLRGWGVLLYNCWLICGRGNRGITSAALHTLTNPSTPVAEASSTHSQAIHKGQGAPTKSRKGREANSSALDKPIYLFLFICIHFPLPIGPPKQFRTSYSFPPYLLDNHLDGKLGQVYVTGPESHIGLPGFKVGSILCHTDASITFKALFHAGCYALWMEKTILCSSSADQLLGSLYGNSSCLFTKLFT